MHRFFISPNCIDGDHAHIEGPIARQAARVLRLGEGQQITLFDDTGWAYRLIIDTVSSRSIAGTIVDRTFGIGNPTIPIKLYQGLLKNDKLEFLLQKGTEVGISYFVPVSTQRSIPKIEESQLQSRYTRWRRIITEAAEQSGRPIMPKLECISTFEEAIQSSSGIRLLAWEGKPDKGLRQVLIENHSNIEKQGVSIFVGPEGGFEDTEVKAAESMGIIPITLGPRILRSETAGVAITSAVLFEMGDFG
jgi:16S rRNA (uracil1498-N3)-methyltransferase